MIYNFCPGSACNYIQSIDSLFLGMAAAQAVRNRRVILAERITLQYRAVARTRPVRVTAFAAGPASEVFDAWEALGRPSDLHACLVDGDPKAVESLKKRSVALDFDGPNASTLLCAAVRKANLAHVAMRKVKLGFQPQDIVYSLGLTDYLQDELVVKLLDVSFELLRPGGVVIIGNFHEENPDRACLDYVLDWKLIHRSEQDMHRLMSQSRFADPCCSIIREPTGVQMLAVGVRPLDASL
jgi:hypothetical protein